LCGVGSLPAAAGEDLLSTGVDPQLLAIPCLFVIMKRRSIAKKNKYYY
jgi:hypothetical protein